MNRGELLRAAGVFVVVLVVTAGGTALAAPLFTSAPAPTDAGQAAPDQWAPDQIIATEGPENGSITVEDGGAEKVVLIDRAHGNRFDDGEIQALVSSLVAAGHEVRFYGSAGERGGPPREELNASLREADAFVVINPSREFSQSEVNGVEAFAEAGGRVLFAGDPTGFAGGFFFVERVPSRYTTLGSRFGIGFGDGYLFNMERNANNYQSVYATPAGESSLTEGVDRVVVRDAAPVAVEGGETLLTAGAETRLSTSRRADEYPLLVRTGNVTAMGDTALFDEASAYDADNEVLLGNLIEYLVTGEKVEGAPAPSEDGNERPPRP